MINIDEILLTPRETVLELDKHIIRPIRSKSCFQLAQE